MLNLLLKLCFKIFIDYIMTLVEILKHKRALLKFLSLSYVVNVIFVVFDEHLDDLK